MSPFLKYHNLTGSYLSILYKGKVKTKKAITGCKVSKKDQKHERCSVVFAELTTEGESTIQIRGLNDVMVNLCI